MAGGGEAGEGEARGPSSIEEGLGTGWVRPKSVERGCLTIQRRGRVSQIQSWKAMPVDLTVEFKPI